MTDNIINHCDSEYYVDQEKMNNALDAVGL